MSATPSLPAAYCPTCGREIPLPLDVDTDGKVESPCDHRPPAEEVVAR